VCRVFCICWGLEKCGGYGWGKYFTKDLEHYSHIDYLSNLEKRRQDAVNALYEAGNKAPRLTPAFDPRHWRPVKPSLTAPVVGSLLAGYGLVMLYRWYDSNIRGNRYFQTKR
jgi:hypothetical protein